MAMVYKSILSVVLLCVILPVIAFAHGVKIFAAAEGDVVKGYVYNSGGSRMQNAEIVVFDPDDKKLGHIKTGADGSFAYKTDLAMEHRFVVQTSDGHRAEFTVPAKVTSQKKHIENNSSGESYAASEDLYHLRTIDLEEIIGRAVAREIILLREQLVIHEEKVRLRDIVGGIGYIFGLAGLACLFQGRKKRQKENSAA